MQTEGYIQRLLFSGFIRQNGDEYISINDLLLVGNKWRTTNNLGLFRYENWYNSSATKKFLSALEAQIDKPPIVSKKGKTGERWVHLFVFLDIVLNIDPHLKVEDYSWIYDQLIKSKYSNGSGDRFKKMCGALFAAYKNKSRFHRGLSLTVKLIDDACNNRQTDNEEQLRLRDEIYENIALLCDVLRDHKQAVRVGIAKAIS